MRVSWLLFLVVAASACKPITMPAQVMFEPQPRAPGRATTPLEPAILSAHLGAAGELLVVFSHEVDPSSLDPQGFLVAFDAGLTVVSLYRVGTPAQKLLGAVLTGNDPHRAAAVAVLNALNRTLGNLLSR